MIGLNIDSCQSLSERRSVSDSPLFPDRGFLSLTRRSEKVEILAVCAALG